jgi:hypothetical protein
VHAVGVGVGVIVGVAVAVGLAVALSVGVALAVAARVEVAVEVADAVAVEVAVGVDVAVAPVAVAVAVGVAPPVDVAVGVAVCVVVIVAVAVEVGVGLGTGVPLPSPFILTWSAFLLAALTIVSLADFLPSDDGVKTIDTSQLPFGAKLPTQLLEGLNCGFCDPIELTSIAIGFGLWIVTVAGALGLSGGSSPKISFFGETVRALGLLVLADGPSPTLCAHATVTTPPIKTESASAAITNKSEKLGTNRESDLKRKVARSFRFESRV